MQLSILIIVFPPNMFSFQFIFSKWTQCTIIFINYYKVVGFAYATLPLVLVFLSQYICKLTVKPETQLIDCGFDFVENVNLHVIVIIDDFDKT